RAGPPARRRGARRGGTRRSLPRSLCPLPWQRRARVRRAAIKMIAEAGGISVLAHPWCCKNPLLVVPKLAAAGINGVELGGSDFHGIDPHTEHAPGDIPLPRKHLDKFLAAAKDMWAEPLRKKIAGLCAARSS
ncbi:hypothetical protein SPRG_17145, partial [Saprolegnia parasitica CBS 223.65]